jgi:Chromo (CHRromatin Organisation MOdifier) domain
VAKILQHWVGRSGLQFLVRWTGYDASKDMWLAERESSGAARLLRAYRRSVGV